MASTPIPLSGSVGGAPVFLSDETLPGTLVHENPADSGSNHVVTEVLVVNPGPITVTLWTSIQGPGITPPTIKTQSQLIRIDVPPTSEGNEPRLFYTPFILAPGYSYYVSTTDIPNQPPSYLNGMVETFPVDEGAIGGYGGLIHRTDHSFASIPATTWVTLDFEEGQVANPVNVTQDTVNNTVALLAEGVWYISTYGTYTCDKDPSNDRFLYIRFYNETDGTPVTSNPFPTFVENNSDNSGWSFTTLLDIPTGLVNKDIRIDLGGSTFAFTNMVLHKVGVSFVRIAPTIGA